MKKLFVFMAVVLLLFTAYQRNITYGQMSNEAILVKGFEFSEANILQSNIDCSAKLNETIWDSEKLEGLAEQLARALITEGDLTPLETNFSDSVVSIKGYATNQDNEFIELELFTNKTGDNVGTFAVVNIVREHEFRDIGPIKRRVESAYKLVNALPKINISITGTYCGKLEESNLDHLKQSILSGINARTVENLNKGNLMDVEVYSPMIRTVFNGNTSSNNSNISITMRYNPLEDKTYIRIEMPDMNNKAL